MEKQKESFYLNGDSKKEIEEFENLVKKYFKVDEISEEERKELFTEIIPNFIRELLIQSTSSDALETKIGKILALSKLHINYENSEILDLAKSLETNDITFSDAQSTFEEIIFYIMKKHIYGIGEAGVGGCQSCQKKLEKKQMSEEDDKNL